MTPSKTWFRMYGDVINNPKVMSLRAELAWFWVQCLCLYSTRGSLPVDEHCAFALRMKPSEFTRKLQRLHDVELFVDRKPFNWNKFQYESDVSTERVKRFRERFGNATETPSDTDTDTDTEQRQKQTRETRVAVPPPTASLPPVRPKKTSVKDPEFEPWFERIWARHPKKVDLLPAQRTTADYYNRGLIDLEEFERIHAMHCETELWTKENGGFAPKLANWITDQGYKFEPVVPLKSMSRLELIAKNLREC